MSSREDGPPPKKSRRLANKRQSVNNTVPQVSIKDQIVEAVTAAIPSITQSVVNILQQKGFIGVDNSVNQTVHTEQSSNQAVNMDSTNNAMLRSDNAQSLQSANNSSDVNNRVILEGSQQIPLIDLSPSVSMSNSSNANKQPVTQIDNHTGTECSNINFNAPGIQVLNSLLAGGEDYPAGCP